MRVYYKKTVHKYILQFGWEIILIKPHFPDLRWEKRTLEYTDWLKEMIFTYSQGVAGTILTLPI